MSDPIKSLSEAEAAAAAQVQAGERVAQSWLRRNVWAVLAVAALAVLLLAWRVL